MRAAVVEEGAETDQHRGEPDKTMQQRDQLRHRGHPHAQRHPRAERAAGEHHQRDRGVAADLAAEQRGDERQGHPGDAAGVAAARAFLGAEPAEAENKQHRGDEIRRIDHAGGHGYLRNILSIR